MGLPVLCVATAIFSLLWGMQNFSRNPVPSICIMIGTVGLSYYLLLLAHYHKTATSVVVGVLILFCGRAIQRVISIKAVYTFCINSFCIFTKA